VSGIVVAVLMMVMSSLLLLELVWDWEGGKAAGREKRIRMFYFTLT
jgi:hypothetical protein